MFIQNILVVHDSLAAIWEKYTSYVRRVKIAISNSISNYKETIAQNDSMVNLLKQNKLIKV